MVSVASLLNHDSEHEQLPTPTASTRYSSECSPAPSERPSKKARIAKDAAVFQKSEVTGEVRYAPHETSDAMTLAEMQRLNVFPLPLAKITEYSRHIPYNSDKKQLYQKTGRDAFEVFQYTFQPPGHERPYVVLWDYNIGLVRMTPFFKCNNFPKTVPSKMLNLNPGLREICHSITGGALVAQGYWVPYEAAKALASNFCWEFRFALVPIFGSEFPNLCSKPGTQGHSTMTIDRGIIHQCTKEVELFRSMQHKSPIKQEPQSGIFTEHTSEHEQYNGSSNRHNTFMPVNRPSGTPIETSIERTYDSIRTPMQTPTSSCLSSPSVSSLDTTNTSTRFRDTMRLPSPQEILNHGSRQIMVTSPSPVSSESSDSDISPKTMPRKLRYFARVQAPKVVEQAESGIISSCANLSPADYEAADILMTMRNGFYGNRVKRLD